MMDKEIVIRLPVSAWNIVLGALVKRPFEEVVNLIPLMQKQAGDQLQEAEQQQAVGTTVPTPAVE